MITGLCTYDRLAVGASRNLATTWSVE